MENSGDVEPVIVARRIEQGGILKFTNEGNIDLPVIEHVCELTVSHVMCMSKLNTVV